MKAVSAFVYPAKKNESTTGYSYQGDFGQWQVDSSFGGSCDSTSDFNNRVSEVKKKSKQMKREKDKTFTDFVMNTHLGE